MLRLRWRLTAPLIIFGLVPLVNLAGPALAQLKPPPNQNPPPATPVPSQSTPPVYNWNLNPLNESHGYILGRVVKAAHVRPYTGVTGAIVGIFYAPLIAEVRLGKSTTRVDRIDQDCVARTEEERRQNTDSPNPPPSQSQINEECRRRFTPIEVRTSSEELVNKLTSSILEPKLISFVEHRIILSTNVYTVATEVYSVNPEHKFSRTFVDRIEDFPISSWFNVERGATFGRIVRAEVEGNFRESYLITVELGPNGNQFMEINVTSSELYRFAIECMLSNRSLKLYYLNLSTMSQAVPELFFGYRTKLRLYRIELAKVEEP